MGALRRLRMVLVAAATWLAAGLVVGVPAVAPPVAVGCGAAAVAGVVLALVVPRRRPGPGDGRARRDAGLVHAVHAVLAVVAVACAAAGASAGQVAGAEPARTAALALVGSGGRAVEAELVVTGKVEPAPFGGVRFVAEARTVRVGERATAAGIPVSVHAAGVPSGTDLGARLAVRALAEPAEPGDRAVLALEVRDRMRLLEPPAGVLAWAADARRGLGAATAGLPEPGAGLVPGLAVGDTGGVDPELDAAMKTASLSHLTAVSGANCAVVVGIAVALASLAGARRPWRVVAGLAALAGFVVLVSPEASVVRAAAMAAIAMVALVLGRPAAGLAVLSLAVTVVLVADPWLSRSLGFALSVAATAALLVLTRPLARGLERVLPRPLAVALAVPLAAQLACGPLLLLIRPEVSVLGVVANLLAAPAAPLATVAGLAACLTGPLPLVSSGLAAIAWLPAAWIAGVARTFAEGGAIAWADGPAGVVLLAIAGGVLFVAIAGVRWRGRDRPRVRALALVLVAVTGGAGTGQWMLTTVVAVWTVPSDWSIAACDVGQGDALLVRSAGRVMMIDAGEDPGPARVCLDRLGVHRVDVLVLTHFDLDHVGGADAVAGRVRLLLHGPPASAADERVLASVRAERTEAAAAGMTGDLGEARWRVLWPAARSPAFPSGNGASVVVSVTGGGVPDAVFLGDLDAAAQRALVASGRLPARVDVVKVAHHGSADQDAGLYDRLGARLALISVGAGNDYGHPRDQTLAFLAADRATIARTDLDGLVLVAADERGLRVWRDHRGRRALRARRRASRWGTGARSRSGRTGSGRPR
jgi:competence protein ComEC